MRWKERRVRIYSIMAKRVNEKNFQAEVVDAEEPVLVEFYSDGCLGCKQISPVLGKLEEQYERQIKIVKVNAAFSEELKVKYRIEVYPTILLFRNGEEVKRLKGAVAQSVIEQVIRDAAHHL